MQSDAPTDDLRVRPALGPDIADIAEIERASFSDPWSAASFRSLIGHPATWFAVAEQGGRVVGYVVLIVAADEAELGNIAIVETERRHGIGSRLLAATIAEAVRRGARSIYLEVRDSNAAARSLYAVHGFREVSRRRRYYRRPVEDAIVLRWSADDHHD